MNKILLILLIFSFVFTQEPCEGTCLSVEETENMVNNIKELQFNLSKYEEINLNLEDQIKIYSEKSRSMNLAFDITPAKYVTALFTEIGICKATTKGLRDLFKK